MTPFYYCSDNDNGNGVYHPSFADAGHKQSEWIKSLERLQRYFLTHLKRNAPSYPCSTSGGGAEAESWWASPLSRFLFHDSFNLVKFANPNQAHDKPHAHFQTALSTEKASAAVHHEFRVLERRNCTAGRRRIAEDKCQPISDSD